MNIRYIIHSIKLPDPQPESQPPDVIPPPPDPQPPVDDTPQINQAHIGGEPGTGYENEDGKGEFECANCEFFEQESLSCGQEEMMKYSKRARVAGTDRVIVEPEGCCEYVKRKMHDDKSYDDKHD